MSEQHAKLPSRRTAATMLLAVAMFVAGAYFAPAGAVTLTLQLPEDEILDCTHKGVSEFVCPDTAPDLRGMMGRDLDHVSVTYWMRSGRGISRRLPPGTDAVFFTRRSTRNILVRYYQQTNPARADSLTAALNAPR